MRFLIFFLLLCSCSSVFQGERLALEKRVTFLAIKVNNTEEGTRFHLIESYCGEGGTPKGNFKRTMGVHYDIFRKISELEISGIVLFFQEGRSNSIKFYPCDRTPARYQKYCLN
jgi:hypothetical protein